MPSPTDQLWSEEAERQFLSVLLHGTAWDSEGREQVLVADRIIELLPTAEAFFKPAHRIIYQAALDLHARGEIVTLATVRTAIPDLSKIGGSVTLVEIAEEWPGTDHFLEGQARQIRSLYIRRQAVEVFNRGLSSAYSTDPVDDILAAAERDIYRLRLGSSTQRLVHVSEIMPDTLEDIQAWQSGEIQQRLATSGFSDLDKLLVGITAGDLMILGGKTSHGKSQAALQIAANVAKGGKAVVVCSLEMTNLEVNKRVLLAEAKIDGMKVKWQQVTDQNFDELTRAGVILSGRQIYYIDDTTITISRLQSLCRKLRTEHELGLVVVDYLQLMAPDERQETRDQDVAAVTRGCKWLAKDLGCPVLALSQFRKLMGGDNHEPGVDDLRESGAIAHAADWILFVWHDDKDRHWMILKKARHGSVGRVQMSFEGGRWETLATSRDADERYSVMEDRKDVNPF